MLSCDLLVWLVSLLCPNMMPLYDLFLCCALIWSPCMIYSFFVPYCDPCMFCFLGALLWPLVCFLSWCPTVTLCVLVSWFFFFVMPCVFYFHNALMWTPLYILLSWFLTKIPSCVLLSKSSTSIMYVLVSWILTKIPLCVLVLWCSVVIPLYILLLLCLWYPCMFWFHTLLWPLVSFVLMMPYCDPLICLVFTMPYCDPVLCSYAWLMIGSHVVLWQNHLRWLW